MQLKCLVAAVLLIAQWSSCDGQASIQHKQSPSVLPSPRQKHRCLSPDPSKLHPLFGTKTTYTEAYKLIKKSSESVRDAVPSHCEPMMFYLFKRHGIRYPDGEDIPEIEKLLEELRQQLEIFHTTHKTSTGQPGSPVLCDEDVEIIRKWRINMKETDDNLITDTGATEISTIAKRFQELYPSLLDPDRGAHMDIAISDRIRTNQTAFHFVKQLYQDKKVPFAFKPNVRLDLTDFHSICSDSLKSQGVYLKNPPVYDDFLRSVTMTKVREAVSKRLGLSEPLAIKKFKMLYKGCSFGFAVNQDISWCSVFTNQELRIIEFLEDLDDYFGDAYGRDINSRAPCVAIEDILSKIEDSIHADESSHHHQHHHQHRSSLSSSSATTSNSKTPEAFLRFSHAGAIKQMLSYLGMFTSLHVSDFNVSADYSCESESHDISTSNEWRSSLISPFSSNVAFVLHKCSNSTPSSNISQFDYRILTLLQETPVKIKGCPSSLCPLDQFVGNLRTNTMCNLKKICRL